VREIGRIADVPINEFVVRNDCPCGSTIGPMISAKTGIRVVDAGMPQLSMHSCREVMGIADLTHGRNLFHAFYKHFRSVDENLSKTIE
jgi:aspartyl aminopeptidase